MGRTGKWCAYQHYGIQPDMTTLAKPIAGGIPLGAVLCTEEVARSFHPGMHGTTFGGGPLACAVAIAVIDAIEKEGLLANATAVGDYFQEQLRGLAKSMKRLWTCEARADGCRRAGFRRTWQDSPLQRC
jgi:acetylornithine/N-succinyldiaminopimelate aminotransferase